MNPFKLNSTACFQHTALRNTGGVLTVKLSEGSLGVREYSRFKSFIKERGDFRDSDIYEMTITDKTEISGDEEALIRKKQILLVKLHGISLEHYTKIAQLIFTPRILQLKRVFIFSSKMDNFIPIDKVKQSLGEDIWTPAINAYKEVENVCFLDMDGVLCNNRTSILTNWACTDSSEFKHSPIMAIKALDQVGIKFLSRLSAAAGIKFVLSSQWRIDMTDDDIMALGRYMNIPIIGRVVNGGDRRQEIAKWIRENTPRGRVCSLDDERFSVPGVVPFIVKPGDGITWETMSDMCNFFGINVHALCDSRFNYLAG